MEIEAIETLLRSISQEIELQRRIPKRFNVFELTEVKHYETRHSSILAGILDWNGSRKPMEMFLVNILGLDLSEEQLKGLSVFTEYSIAVDDEERRLDILIRGKDVNIVIENKIYTEDHTHQLEAYKKWLTCQNCRHDVLVYLTLEGTASTENFPEDQYVRISWKKEIREFLVSCLSLTNVDSRFNSTILQYAEFWENWFMQNDETTKKVCETILKTADSYLAAQKVFWTFKEAKHKLIVNVQNLVMNSGSFGRRP